MKRMKTFLIYLILFLLFYVFSNVMIYLNIRSTSKNIENGTVEFQNPEIIVEEAKASRVNAIIKGKMSSQEGQTVQYKYVRVDLLSDRGNVLNSRFIDISDIANGGQKEFTIRTNTENVNAYKFVLTDINETSEIDIKMHEISEWLLGAFLVWLII